MKRVFLAFVLAASAFPAFAGPTWHVSIDTRTLSGNGYLDLTLAALDGAAPATVTLSNFSGNFGPASYLAGDVTGSVGAGLTFSNTATFNELLQAVGFGGVFGFDARFDVAPAGTIGSTFGVALVNEAMTDYVSGTGADFLLIDLAPGLSPSIAGANPLASVTDVPEPSGAALFGVGLLLVGGAGRLLRTPAAAYRTT